MAGCSDCAGLPAFISHAPPLHPPAQHTADEYGSEVGPDGLHRGGPFTIEVSPKMRVEELRIVIRVRLLLGMAGCMEIGATHTRDSGSRRAVLSERAGLECGPGPLGVCMCECCGAVTSVYPCRTRVASFRACSSWHTLARTWTTRNAHWSSECHAFRA